MSEPILLTSHTIVEQLYRNLKTRIDRLIASGHQPKLAVVLVGDDPNSITYVAIKQRQAEALGLGFVLHHLAAGVDETAVLAVIEQLNQEPAVSGIIVQLPLPEQLETETILKAVEPEKDVDGLNRKSQFKPPTVQAILELFSAYDIDLTDKQIVLVGKGRLVGGPLLTQLEKLGYRPTVCDESTDDLAACTLQADILISATGQPHLITPTMVKDQAIIIDVDHEVVFDEVLPKVKAITPQKGAVGPLTVAILLSHVVEAAEQVQL